jgi:putative SOS response-associated peptidase YedK
MQPLHHRMPVLMDWAAGSRWLESTATAEQLMQLLLDRQSSELQAWPVSKAVNNPVNDSEQLIARVVA